MTHRQSARVPVIGSIAYGSTRSRCAPDAGLRQLLAKPFDPTQLVHTIAKTRFKNLTPPLEQFAVYLTVGGPEVLGAGALQLDGTSSLSVERMSVDSLVSTSR